MTTSSERTTAGLRADEIRRAAIQVFAAQGYRGTSMADLAQAAGVSRPALYQYFDNRADIFRAAFDALLNDAADAALAALAADGSLESQLDGFLQRAFGDGYEAFAATAFGAELMEAKYEFAADVAVDARERERAGLRRFLKSRASARAARDAIDLLTLAPVGLKSDGVAPKEFRRRLSALARAAAARLDARA